MTTRTLSLLALAGAAWTCQVTPPRKPQEPLDPGNPRSLAEHAIYNTRIRSYQTRFKARISPPRGDSIDYRGTTIRLAQGVLYIHYTATGGDLKNIVGVGPDYVWVWHEGAGEWVRPEAIGSPGIGRGLQNPDELLDVLGRHLGGARLRGPGVVEIAFSGEAIARIMRDHARHDQFHWMESSAAIELHADSETRLKKITCRAELKSADPNVRGVVQYTAETEVETYDPPQEMKFYDGDKKEVPIGGKIREAINAVLKEKK